jgi:hypothetical protein
VTNADQAQPTRRGYGNFDLRPIVGGGDPSASVAGWDEVARRLAEATRGHQTGRRVIACDCYVGVDESEIIDALAPALEPVLAIDTNDALHDEHVIEEMLSPFLGDSDPIFGVLTDLDLVAFFDPDRVDQLRAQIGSVTDGVVLIVGPGAAMFDSDTLVFADLARWEAQLRQRRGTASNLAVANRGARPGELYKRSFFVDWRVNDRWKMSIFDRIDFLLDTNVPGEPRLVDADALHDALRRTARRPFRLVPFFDPGPWGGHWMESVCGLDGDAPNHAWCFDCVPEENSLLLGFGETVVEIPALDLVLREPEPLLGRAVVERFGAEFPIRFDLLDTMGGGNLSLQVHPTTDYIAQFGLTYTQDESYYILDADDDAAVYLGLRSDIDPAEMLSALRTAQADGPEFDADRFVNKWPARAHDHFHIPAGTVHCSGANTMVLEISATPYIFTFKLWDWGRLGLDGRPRPINIDRGADVIDWSRDTDWVRDNLIDQIEPIDRAPGWREERTGLHDLQFIETRRRWFTEPVTHPRNGSVDVVNLVHGAEATIESPTGAFEPFVVHYAETFVVPAAAGEYTIRPSGPATGAECATITAFVRLDEGDAT